MTTNQPKDDLTDRETDLEIAHAQECEIEERHSYKACPDFAYDDEFVEFGYGEVDGPIDTYRA